MCFIIKIMYYILMNLYFCYYSDIARGKEKVPIPVVNDADDCNYPTDFTYVTESVFTSHVPVNTTINSLNVSVSTLPSTV